MFRKCLSREMVSPIYWDRRCQNGPAVMGLWVLAATILYNSWILFPTTWKTHVNFWQQPASALGYLVKFGLLPYDFVMNSHVFIYGLFIIGILSLFLWLFHIHIPYTPLVCSVTFWLFNSVIIEKWQYAGIHVIQMQIFALWIYAAWYYYERDQVGGVREWFYKRRFPRWAFFLMVLTVASYYFFSGLYKLRIAGWEWADGLTLQAYVHTLSPDRSNFPSELILSSRRLAKYLQMGVLILELSALLSLFSKYLRYAIGGALLLFHAMVMWTFSLLFIGNVVVILVFMTPFHRIFGVRET